MKKVFILGIILILTKSLSAQENYPCEEESYSILSRMIGTWKVETTDRISPGSYEENSGISVISEAINGCGIQENYSGLFKGSPFAASTSIAITDSMSVERTYVDSQHGGFMLFDGKISDSGMSMLWFRDPQKKRMQVSLDIQFADESFVLETRLSTDYGETWAMTHQWTYVKEFSEVEKTEFEKVTQVLSQYHDGFNLKNAEMVTNSLASNFIMYNGNFSSSSRNWEGHLFLSGDELVEWPLLFIKEATPYSNKYKVLHVSVRGNAAIVVTQDSGRNKFRSWENEETTWLLGKVEEEWKILGYYLRNISNPE